MRCRKIGAPLKAAASVLAVAAFHKRIYRSPGVYYSYFGWSLVDIGLLRFMRLWRIPWAFTILEWAKDDCSVLNCGVDEEYMDLVK